MMSLIHVMVTMSVFAFPWCVSSASRHICAHAWKILGGKRLAIEGLGHKVCTSSVLSVIAKLISKRVTPIYIHSGSVREYFSQQTQQNLASYHGREKVSHFNSHMGDLLMWANVLVYVSLGRLIFTVCASSVGILCPSLPVDYLSL